MANRPRNYRKIPPLAKVKEDLAAGMTPTRMADAYNVGHSTISHFLSKHGLSNPIRIDYPDDEVFIACMRERMSIADMAQQFGISRHSVRHRVITRGLRDLIDMPPAPPAPPAGLLPGPAKVINHYGVSIPRIPTIHGHFEVRA